MTLELYETETQSETVYDVRQNPRGAFMIIDHPESETNAAEEQCYVTCERIMADMLRQIWQIHYKPGVSRCATPFKDFSFNKLVITPVGPIFNREFGYRVEFDFTFQNNINIATPPEEGTFIAT